jgi:antirestriction protein ArdC
MARWGKLLRAAARQASAFPLRGTLGFWHLRKIQKPDFPAPPKKQPLALASRPSRALGVPQEAAAEKELNTMTEEITDRQTAEQTSAVVPAGQPAPTGSARVSAEREERPDRKPMVSWAALLEEAVSKPGFVHQAYSRFHAYSFGNQSLALYQCVERNLQPGPLAPFLQWKQLGRHVKKGEKAITLCMPFTCKRTRTVRKDDGTSQEERFAFTHFMWKQRWFVLSQTEGAEYQAPPIPEWNEQKALAALKIERIPFEDLDGNTQGYARRGGKIAISPLAALPFKTLMHELAHSILHCNDKDMADTEQTPRSVAEVEAEAVALLCCESLALPGAEFSRGYIQSYAKGQPISERSAQRIFHAADRILKAGYAEKLTTEAP